MFAFEPSRVMKRTEREGISRMDYTTLFTAQITDVFRIGLLTALMYTTENTKAQTGVVIPLLAGIVFVAVILPMTMPVAGVSTTQAIVTGLLANACLTAVIWAIWNTAKKYIQK
jgi:MFS superfamily sulfate permease-like transporter